MKIVKPLILGFESTAHANACLAVLDCKVKGPAAFLHKNGPEYDALKACAGFQCLTVVVALPAPHEGVELEAKSYLPRSVAGLFDGFSLVTANNEVAVCELFRKRPLGKVGL